MSNPHFTYDTESQGLVVRLETSDPGLMGRLFGPKPSKMLPLDDRELAFAMADLRAMAQEDEGALQVSDTELRLSHELVACLDDRTAERLGLPPVVDLVFKCSVEGLLGSPTFELHYKWTRGGQKVQTRQNGAILQTDRGERRIPYPILQAIRIAKKFDPSAPLIDHWAGLAQFKRSLDPEHPKEPDQPDFSAISRMTGFLGSLKIASADALSVSPVEAPDGLDFDPVPFSRRRLERLEGGAEIAEKHGELSGDELRAFQAGVRSRGPAMAYKTGENSYLVIDRAAMPVLTVMAEKQRAPAGERDAFVRNPRPAITIAVEEALRLGGALEGLTDEQVEAAVETAADSGIVETAEFSRRVVGVGHWQAPELPLPPAAPTTWLPEIFEEPLRSKIGAMAAKDLEDLKSTLEQARAGGAETADWNGDDVPASDEAIRAIETRLADMVKQEEEDSLPGQEKPGPEAPIVLQTTDNFEALAWKPESHPRPAPDSTVLPPEVTTPLMDHQRVSLDWSISAWRQGLPGILNADEQGLGKTLQTIAFLAWLRRQARQGSAPAGGPILVVAPTSLLENWEAEVARHMDDGGLGGLVRLYGRSLTARRRPDSTGRDTKDGMARLDLDFLERKVLEGRGYEHWILTTDTTLTNYQHSLARLRFSAAVFDEVQAIKNPASLRAEAARAMNAEFRIGLTGTPVENRCSDIWAIMDQIAPGALGSLRQFIATFPDGDEEPMRRLHAAVFLPTAGRPALGLRRLKSMVAKDLPPKERFLHPRTMPEEQAEQYEEARAKLASGRRGSALSMLHHIRSVSVHPGMTAMVDDEDQAFIGASARLSACFDILRSIKARQERALLFVEHRRMQYRVVELIRRNFGLTGVEIINGNTPVQKRMAIVNRFQEATEGFNVLVLGPRAAGTGLTLTAANHVIHLSRWWNPAVEEQCNDRVHRIGQTRAVSIHVPLALHPKYRTASFDCLLQDLMQRKRHLASTVLWPAGDTPEDASALEEALARPEAANAASMDPPADGAALAQSLANFQRFAPPMKLAPGVYELPPTDERCGSIVVITDEAPQPDAALQAVTADRAGTIRAGFVFSTGYEIYKKGPAPDLPFPTAYLGADNKGVWPDYALGDD